MIRIIKENVMNFKEDIMAHGCNCVGGFGAGVALAVAKMHPEVKAAYLSRHRQKPWTIGEVQVVKLQNDKHIANVMTQKNYLPRGVDLFEYDAFRSICKELKQLCVKNSWSLAFPKIGAGLAGGDWSRIYKIMEEELVDIDVCVYVWP